MNSILSQLTDWLHDILVDAVMDSLSGMFDSVNQQVGDVATLVGTTPAGFSPRVFSMIQSVSESVILPIAGIFLTIIACYELIQMLIEHNNMANFETWILFKWIFKTFMAVMLITNCFTITMAVFDMAQHVVSSSGSLISGSTAVDSTTLETLRTSVEALEIGELFSLTFQNLILNTGFKLISGVIFLIVYGRMIEIYLMVSLAPIPFSTFGNREQSQIGQNYLRSLMALGFQGFLILICVGIYAVLIQSVAISSTDIANSLWNVMFFTLLLAFTLFKTGSLAKQIFSAH